MERQRPATKAQLQINWNGQRDMFAQEVIRESVHKHGLSVYFTHTTQPENENSPTNLDISIPKSHENLGDTLKDQIERLPYQITVNNILSAK